MAGATPTIPQCDTMLQNACKFLRTLRDAAAVNADNLLDDAKTYTDSIVSDHLQSAINGVQRVRNQVSAALGQSTVRAVLDPVFRAYGQAIEAPEQASIASIFADVKRVFQRDAKTVQTRAFVRGAVTMSGTNVGNGTIYRLTVDQFGSGIEDTYADDWTAQVIRDSAGGATRNREVWEVRGKNRAPDEMQRRGSGVKTTLTTSDEFAGGLLTNPGFDSLSGTEASPDAIPGWVSDITIDSTNYSFDSTNIYLPKARANDIRRSLNIKATATLTQRLDERGGLRDDTPYFCQVAFNRAVGAASGTLELHLGAISASVAIAAQVGWNVLLLPVGFNNWLRQLDEDEIDAKLVWTRTGGELLVDSLILVPYEEIDNLWHTAIAGSIPFQGVEGDPDADAATWSDSETGSTIQHELWVGDYGFLPHSATPTVPDL